MPLFKSKYQLAEPGIDPISNPLPHTGGAGIHFDCFTWIIIICGAILLIGFLVKFSMGAKAAPKATVTPTVLISTHTATLTTTPTQTLTTTPTITGTTHPTLPGLPPGFNTQTNAPQIITRYITQPIMVVQTQIVKETVIVIWVQTVVVTATETYTPTVTKTPTLEPTQPDPTEVPTRTKSPTLTETPTETPTDLPSETSTDTEMPSETPTDLPAG